MDENGGRRPQAALHREAAQRDVADVHRSSVQPGSNGQHRGGTELIRVTGRGTRPPRRTLGWLTPAEAFSQLLESPVAPTGCNQPLLGGAGNTLALGRAGRGPPRARRFAWLGWVGPPRPRRAAPKPAGDK